MTDSRVGRKLAWIAVAVAVFIVIVPLAFLSGAGAVKVTPLGLGVLLLGVALTYLQLSYWREGDSAQRPTAHTQRADVPGTGDDTRTGATRTGATLLYAPRLRRVWLLVDESRRLVEQREKEEDARRRAREKIRLRLTEVEDIQLIGEQSLWMYWPLVLFSGIALAASAWRAPGTAGSFMCLFVGLAGLLAVSVFRARTKYYLTNFRLLVRKRCLWREDRWLALRYENIERFDWYNGVFGKELTFHTNAERARIRGLAAREVSEMNRVLKEQLPAEVYARYTPAD